MGNGSVVIDPMQIHFPQREWLIRCALVLICAGFWYSQLNYFSFPLLVFAWLIDGGWRRFNEALRLPVVQAMFLLCALLLIGLFWSESVPDGRMKWLKYFVLLIFVPFYLLLNKQRLPWALGGLAVGYAGVLALGVYQWLAVGVQGIPLLGMSYLSFSAMLGVGATVAVSFACMSQSLKLQVCLGIAALLLMLVQFHQNARALLLATLISVTLLIFLRYKMAIKRMFGIVLFLTVAMTIFAWSSPVFEDRLMLLRNDIALLQHGNYNSSLGYRLAMWDVGMHAILDRPLTGYGTGMPVHYFEQAIVTYKDGLYRDLPGFQKTSHFHNDWIEIGMHIGVPGMLVLLFLFWGWYQLFKANQLVFLGTGLLSYLFVAGLTDTFLIFSRTPILMLIITATAIDWRQRCNGIG